MQSKGLTGALAVVFFPVAVLAQASPTPVPTPTPGPSAVPSATSMPAHAVLVGCTVGFESATTPTTPGGPSYLRTRTYAITTYSEIETPLGGHFVEAKAPTADQDLVAGLNDDLAKKYIFLNIKFTCPGKSITVPNTAVATAVASGSIETFTVNLPVVNPPHVPIPKPHISSRI